MHFSLLKGQALSPEVHFLKLVSVPARPAHGNIHVFRKIPLPHPVKSDGGGARGGGVSNYIEDDFLL